MRWTWGPGFDDCKIDLRESDEIPILVHRDGYPHAVRDDGVRSRDVPHVEVKNLGRWLNGVRSDGTWFVSASTGYMSGRDTQLMVGEAGTLDDALSLLPMAVERARGARAEVAAAAKRISRASGGGLDRASYEALCEEFGLTPKADEALRHHLGDPRWPEVPIESVQAFMLARRRQRVLEQEVEAAARAARQLAQAAREATLVQLRERPVVETYSKVVPAASRWHVGHEFVEAGRLHCVVATKPVGRISADDPAVHGEHLLGWEGAEAHRATVEVRA